MTAALSKGYNATAMDKAIICQLVYLLRRESTGRRTLAKRTGLTESTVRTHLKKLKAQKYITSSKAGVALTPMGRRAFKPILEKVKEVRELDLKELKLDRFNSAALITGVGRLEELWRYRDLAIRAGATAALFLSRVRGDLRFVDTGHKVSEQNPKDAHHIESVFKGGDFIVMAFAARRAEANKGLWQIISRALK